MKTLLFTLSMPNVGSWNGKWTSADKCFAIKHIVNDDLAKKIMKNVQSKPIYKDCFNSELIGYAPPSCNYLYNFGDGWCACVKVTQITAKEANKVMKKSQGFAGYDWMIYSILSNQEIIPNK